MTVSVFSGEELLASEDDDQKPDAVTELADERPPSGIGKVRAQESFREQRKPHREPRGQTRPRERCGIARQFISAFAVDRAIDDLPLRRLLLVRLQRAAGPLSSPSGWGIPIRVPPRDLW